MSASDRVTVVALMGMASPERDSESGRETMSFGTENDGLDSLPSKCCPLSCGTTDDSMTCTAVRQLLRRRVLYN